MRPILLLCALGLAGCGDADSSSAPDMTVACVTQCSSACASGTVCVGGKTFAAACLSPCQSTDDCSGGTTCVSIADASPSGNYCVSDGNPPNCAFCSSPAIITCDGDVLLRPYRASVCGLSRTRCPGGCGPSADGGSGAGLCH